MLYEKVDIYIIQAHLNNWSRQVIKNFFKREKALLFKSLANNIINILLISSFWTKNLITWVFQLGSRIKKSPEPGPLPFDMRLHCHRPLSISKFAGSARDETYSS